MLHKVQCDFYSRSPTSTAAHKPVSELHVHVHASMSIITGDSTDDQFYYLSRGDSFFLVACDKPERRGEEQQQQQQHQQREHGLQTE